MAETGHRFDPEFREGAVRIVRATGTSIAQVARDLGSNDGTLASWVKRARERRGEAAAGQLSEDNLAELARLRRENAGRRCVVGSEDVLNPCVGPLVRSLGGVR